jgi:mRNA interferase MazF
VHNRIYLPIIIVVPLTSKINKKCFLPTHVFITSSCGSGLSRGSIAFEEKVETIDKEQLLEKKEKGSILSLTIMEKITTAIQIQIGVFNEYN